MQSVVTNYYININLYCLIIAPSFFLFWEFSPFRSSIIMKLPNVFKHADHGFCPLDLFFLFLSLCFLNKIIDILENHSESLSFSLSLQEKREIEKKERDSEWFFRMSIQLFKNSGSEPELFERTSGIYPELNPEVIEWRHVWGYR